MTPSVICTREAFIQRYLILNPIPARDRVEARMASLEHAFRPDGFFIAWSEESRCWRIFAYGGDSLFETPQSADCICPIGG
jgi:hypothetical protein